MPHMVSICMHACMHVFYVQCFTSICEPNYETTQVAWTAECPGCQSISIAHTLILCVTKWHKRCPTMRATADNNKTWAHNPHHNQALVLHSTEDGTHSKPGPGSGIFPRNHKHQNYELHEHTSLNGQSTTCRQGLEDPCSFVCQEQEFQAWYQSSRRHGQQASSIWIHSQHQKRIPGHRKPSRQCCQAQVQQRNNYHTIRIHAVSFTETDPPGETSHRCCQHRTAGWGMPEEPPL